MTDITDRFQDIRPLLDSEVPEAVARLVADRGFRRAVEPIMKPLSWEQFSGIVTRCKSKDDFQAQIIHPLLKR